jgi:hypothetical protein
MEFVFFGEDLPNRAPDVIGHVYDVEGNQWASMFDVILALMEGKKVSIRQATETELKRAEALIVVQELGYNIALCVHQLMEQDGPDAVDAALNHVRGVFESADDGVPYQLLDR